MLKTGISFIDTLAFILVFLPLLPIAIAVLRRNYSSDPIHLLIILCLVLFFRNSISQRLLTNSSPAILHIFTIVETVLYALLFGLRLGTKEKEVLKILLFIFLTATLSFFLFYGIDRQTNLLDNFQDLLVIALIVYCLPGLIRRDGLLIFRKAQFWIAAGTLFYLATALLVTMTIFNMGDTRKNPATNNDQTLILDLANFMRLAFYSVAVASFVRGHPEIPD